MPVTKLFKDTEVETEYFEVFGLMDDLVAFIVTSEENNCETLIQLNVKDVDELINELKSISFKIKRGKEYEPNKEFLFNNDKCIK